MTVEVPATLLISFLLVVARTSAWVALAPPFGTRGVPAVVKVGLSIALALPMAPQLVQQAPPPEIGPLVLAILMQVGCGLALGYLTSLLFSAVQAAGALVDLFSGFSLAQVLDPMSEAGTTPFGRFYEAFAITLLFVADGHLLLIRGFLSSFTVLPLKADVGALTRLGTDTLGTFAVSALEIAAPLVGVLFVAELGLGLLAKAAPSLNVFNTAFPVKILLSLSLTGVTLMLLPGGVDHLVERILHTTALASRLFPR